MSMTVSSGCRPWLPVIVAAIAGSWFEFVRRAVPEEYLDEVFHVPQAYNYVQGNWRVWDSKITTPPGLYIASYPIARLTRAFAPIGITTFRFTNLLGGILLLGFIIKLLLLLDSTLSSAVKRTPAESLHTGVNIYLFPPLFFFYALYYTDVLSALSVLVTYRLFLDKERAALIVLSGVISLWFRQTNVLWVSVFLGGLALSHSIPKGQAQFAFSESPTFLDVVKASWQNATAYDPPIDEAGFEDYVKSGLSFAVATVANLPRALQAIGPYLLILAIFGLYIIWNNGVVLGDKENHVVSIHLAQMLYLWPSFVFFSLPLLYPYIVNTVVPSSLLPEGFHISSIHVHRPRTVVALAIIVVMTAIVHYNTIIHPFTLADNRHYTFYVFRILLRHPAIKYLAVPIYFICASAAVAAIGGQPSTKAPISSSRSRKKHSRDDGALPSSKSPVSGNRASFLLVWLLATIASLVTTPLVEPRYFIVPWLIWRLHIAPLRIETKSLDHRLWLETAWFLLINAFTGYIFLTWGFEWPQEPHKVQRFMW